MFDFLGVITYFAYIEECHFSWEICAEVFRGKHHDSLRCFQIVQKNGDTTQTWQIVNKAKEYVCPLNSSFNFSVNLRILKIKPWGKLIALMLQDTQ